MSTWHRGTDDAGVEVVEGSAASVGLVPTDSQTRHPQPQDHTPPSQTYHPRPTVRTSEEIGWLGYLVSTAAKTPKPPPPPQSSTAPPLDGLPARRTQSSGAEKGEGSFE